MKRIVPFVDTKTQTEEDEVVFVEKKKKAVDDPFSASFFTWEIKNFSSSRKEKLYSDIFIAGGYKWRLLLFPSGNGFKGVNSLSLYLAAADLENLPYEGYRSVGFSLAVINQINKNLTVRKAGVHYFLAGASDWGFAKMMPSNTLLSTAGFLVNDVCMVEVKFDTLKISEVIEGRNNEESKASMNEESGKQVVQMDENGSCELPWEDQMGAQKCYLHEETEQFDSIDPSEPPSSPPEIAKVINENAAHPEEDTSKSLSLLKELSIRSFSEIALNLRADLASVFQQLDQVDTLPGEQASAIHDFFKQFGDLCQTYDSAIAASRTAHQYFHTKDETLELFKQLHKSQMVIFTSMDDIKNVIEALQQRLRELEEVYVDVGREVAVVKAEWDGLMVKNSSMAEERKQAEDDMGRAESVWKNFISYFR